MTQTTEQKLAELADASNELCVALRTSLINVDTTKLDSTGKMIFQRMEETRAVLAKLGL